MSIIPSYPVASCTATTDVCEAGGAVEINGLNLFYGDFQALYDVDLKALDGRVTAMIGPSGCGKTTVLRAVNRIHDRLGYVRIDGRISVKGENLLAPDVETRQVRRQIGMVFQRPNPLPLSIRDNVAFAHRLHHPGRLPTSELNDIVEDALRQVALWDQVRDQLNSSALTLSLEAQQKLCIARLLPLKPSILLMDEPCSALDPDGIEAVESLIRTLRGQYTILIVTHNMAQAKRSSDECVYMHMGRVVEAGPTQTLFEHPREVETAQYIEGRFG